MYRNRLKCKNYLKSKNNLKIAFMKEDTNIKCFNWEI